MEIKPRKRMAPDAKKDKRVKELRKKGLSFTEIGKIMGFTKQVAFFRYKRVSRLSTGKAPARK